MDESITISRLKLKQLLDEREDRTLSLLESSLQRGITSALSAAGLIKSHISKSDAYKRFGRAAVDRWLSQGYLRQAKDIDGNSRCRISVVELNKVASQFNHPAVVQGKVRTRKIVISKH